MRSPFRAELSGEAWLKIAAQLPESAVHAARASPIIPQRQSAVALEVRRKGNVAKAAERRGVVGLDLLPQLPAAARKIDPMDLAICSSWFREAFELNRSKVEAMIIHESLHSRGLGESPPRSPDITSRVMARCGG